MHYKTIMLEIIEDHQTLHQKLCSRRTLLPTLESYARMLKSRHQYWKDALYEAEPAPHPS